MTTKGKWGPVVFNVVGAGCLLLAALAFVSQRESRGWPSTPGTVVTAELAARPNPSKDSRRLHLYEPLISYRYTVDGAAFESNRIAVVSTLHSDQQEAEAVVAQYAVGTPVTVFYDPDSPAMAVLVPGGSLAFPVGVALGGLVLFVLAALGRRSERGTVPTEPDPAELEWKRAEYEARKAARAKAGDDASTRRGG